MPIKRLTPVDLTGLGSQGLNTQSSSASLGPEWFTEVSNVVYDYQGRIGPRRGVKMSSKVVASPVKSIGEYIKSDRTTEYYCGSGATVCKIDTSTTPNPLTTQSFSGTPQTITDSNWQWINFNGEFWGVQSGHTVINFDGTNWYDIDDLGAYAAPIGPTTFDPSCGLGKYGRMWYGGITEDPGTLYYSDNLIGEKLNAGAAGSIDLKTVWGNDEIVGLGALMNKIIIFGKNNIVIYEGAHDPSTMVLDELITDIGLAGRDNIVYVSSSLYFMSYEGLQSLGRITETDGKAPMSDLSVAVRNSLTHYLSAADLDTVKSVYYQEDGLVVTFMPENKLAYVFDFAAKPQQGLPRITTWNFADAPLCGLASVDGTFRLGLSTGTGLYSGYYEVTITDDTATLTTQELCEAAGGTWDTTICWLPTENLYNYSWTTPWMNFGDPTGSKILKTGMFVYAGGRGAATTLQLYTDHSLTSPLTKNFNLATDDSPAYYGETDSQYGVSKFVSKVGPLEYKIPLGRVGKTIKMKMVTEVVGDYSSLVSTILLSKQGKIE